MRSFARAFRRVTALGLLLSWPAGWAQAGEEAVASRPILYYGLENGEWVTKAIHADGRSLGTLAKGQLAGWSRRGDRFAWFTKDEATGADLVNVMGLGGQPETIFRARAGERVFPGGWQSIWSPDGGRVALLLTTASGETFTLAIVEVEKKKVAKTFELPRSVYTRGHGPMNWPPYDLEWSPDGRKILLAWEQTIVIDTESKAVETIIAKPAMTEWLPGSDGVYYFEAFGPGDLWLRNIGRNDAVKVLDRAQFAGWDMFGSSLLHAPLVKLSASGSRLAIAGVGGKGTSTILVFDVARTRAGSLGSPAKRLQVDGVVVAMEWDPGERKLAVLVISENDLAIRVLDLAGGAATTLTKVARRGTDYFSTTDLAVVGLANMISWVP